MGNLFYVLFVGSNVIINAVHPFSTVPRDDPTIRRSRARDNANGK